MTRTDFRREIAERLGEQVTDTMVDLMWDNHVMLKALNEISEGGSGRKARKVAQRTLEELDEGE